MGGFDAEDKQRIEMLLKRKAGWDVITVKNASLLAENLCDEEKGHICEQISKAVRSWLRKCFSVGCDGIKKMWKKGKTYWESGEQNDCIWQVRELVVWRCQKVEEWRISFKREQLVLVRIHIRERMVALYGRACIYESKYWSVVKAGNQSLKIGAADAGERVSVKFWDITSFFITLQWLRKGRRMCFSKLSVLETLKSPRLHGAWIPNFSICFWCQVSIQNKEDFLLSVF